MTWYDLNPQMPNVNPDPSTPPQRSRKRRHTLTVNIAHGDLRSATYLLMVGHYVGDTIVSAEAMLDTALDGMLRRRFNAGIYPGPLETAEIVENPGCHPPGAIVVGLGKVGELTPQRLRQTLSVALRRYALLRFESTPKTAELPVAANFSSLLVGSDGGALGSLADFIYAIVRSALDANRALRDAGVFDKVRIERIEFVELYEDMAIRAAQIVANLPGPLAQELNGNETLVGKETMDVRQGGRFLRPANPYVTGWWQRIAVQRKTNPAGADALQADSTTALQFTVLTDRARLEQEVSVGQRALITPLITKATGSTAVDNTLAAALYQLIVPDQVRERITAGGDLLFMVDRAGAGYPFELMAERTADAPRPLADGRGILRQFETEVFRARTEMARANAIFIVGNPKTLLWPNLPGAEDEAKEVKKVAEKHGLAVTLADRGDAERTLIEFITGEYRIVHLAAHGRYDPDPMKSGVIVSDRILITPAEVLRLPLVPELVFLNCCYLGQMSAEQRPVSPDPRLGASLAEGFIQAGVRAVIAAGWAVDDLAGLLFATEFYESFLDGAAFGDAVKAAREMTRRKYSDCNTWGAYQCYGNPEYQFRAAETHRPRVTVPRIVARTEALQALRTMAGDATRVTFGRVKDLTRQFDALYKALPDDWPTHGELLYACGDICGELEQFDRAIKFYRDALHAVPAAVPLVAVEQLANLLARAAATKVIADPAAVPQALQDLDEASKWLDWIDQKLETTRERWALRGSLHKRWAACEPSRRREHLQDASAAYGSGAKLTNAESYQWQNALALDFILAGHDRTSELQQRADSYLDKARQRVNPGNRGFWNIIEYPDALLHRSVVHGTLAEPKILKEVTTGYEQARRVGPTPREWASVRDHIWFLAAMTGDPALECHNPRTADALQILLSSLINH